MIVGILILSELVAAIAAILAWVTGWGLLVSLLIYLLGGSLTVVLLAVIVSRRAEDCDP